MSASPVREINQRELLGLVLGCAARESASFCDALRVAARVRDEHDDDARALARELLTDLTIRNWIYLVRSDEDGSERALPRSRYEMELAAHANWDELRDCERARYALTATGREKLAPLLGTLPLPPA